jgi:hypothetical protein
MILLGTIPCIVLALCQPVSSPSQPQASCSPVVVGVDTSCANGYSSVFLGEARGQTFASVSLDLRRLTVWRVAWEDTNVYGMHLFIMGVDPLGNPDPLNAMLLNGPIVSVPYGHGVGPVRFDFVFDPPFHLPQPGTYCFALQADPCFGFWDILASGSRSPYIDYPGGNLWAFGRSDCPAYLRPYPLGVPDADLVFEMEFCGVATPTRSNSWGELKVLYR